MSILLYDKDRLFNFIMALCGAILALTLSIQTTQAALPAPDSEPQHAASGAQSPAQSIVQSDDFAQCALNSTLWSYIDPKGDGALRLRDGRLELDVAAGSDHDIWYGGNNTVRLLQPADDGDFELEVKFESSIEAAYLIQGILVEQDADNYIRFDFFSTGTEIRLFAAHFNNGAPTIMHNSTIAAGGAAPLLLRVDRVGDTWSQSYSLDGANWAQGASFTHSLTVSKVGVFAGNAGLNPGHTAVVDYFFNREQPIVPEDAALPQRSITITTVGTGSVTRAPDQAGYGCGAVVELTAQPDAGWSFAGWSGDISGNANPAVITLDADANVTATFVEQQAQSYSLNVTTVGNGTVARTPDQAAYAAGTVVTLTATPANGWLFDGWSGGSAAGENPLTLTMNAETSVTATFADAAAAGGPLIDIWYGDEQSFGLLGTPQSWVNILGNVSDADGVQTLHYALNGGPLRQLAVGPDSRRLQRAGDFNIDLAAAELQQGANQLQIHAVDSVGNPAQQTVTVNYFGGNVWPLPYLADWSTAGDIQEVAQVVDGNWWLDSNGLRPRETGYDRLVAIGDVAWTDYVVTVPVTVHRVDIAAAGGISGPPGLGLLVRWTGHTNTPVAGYQPLAGWLPHGDIAWWQWYDADYANLGFFSADTGQGLTPVIGQTYLFQVRVQTLSSSQSRYYLKVWAEDEPEPENWNLVKDSDSSALGNGSLLLLAHFVDATFGEVHVAQAVALEVDRTGLGDVTLAPQQSIYALGDVVTLTATPANGWRFAGWTGDVTGSDNPLTLTLNSDMALTALFESEGGGDPLTLQSDDFAACALDETRWSFINPQGDGAMELTGGQLELIVPGGIGHDLWSSGNNTVRLMQPAGDSDFALEVKFEGGVASAFALQGILVEEDQNNYLRFDFFSDGNNTHLFAARLVNNSPTILYNSQVAANEQAPLYLRVQRVGDAWTQSYSLDGQNWLPAASFDHALTVTAAGVFAGNAGVNPAHTAVVDYFFNRAAVITPEDGAVAQHALDISTVGSGSVAPTPAQATYGCRDVVTLSATPDAGWLFDSWSGDLAGSDNPATITMDAGKALTAHFVPDGGGPVYALTTSVNGSGSITVDPLKATYQAGDVVTLTALAESGWSFSGWSGDLAGSENPVNLIVDGAKSITANFTEATGVQRYALTTAGVGGGSVTRDPAGPLYDAGSDVTLTAVADAGWSFTGWEGDLSGSDNPSTVVMNADKLVTARFDPAAGGGSISGTVWYDANWDGVLDPADGDIRLSNYTVILLDVGADNELTVGDTVVGTQISTAEGAYGFVDLPAGNYLIAVTPSTSAPAGTVVKASEVQELRMLDRESVATIVLGIGEHRTDFDIRVLADLDEKHFLPLIQR